jgi:hypothetical protein
MNIVKPIKFEAGEAIPWFGQPSKGTHILLKMERMIEKG